MPADTLDLGKLEAGRLELESIPFDLTQLLHSQVVMHTAVAESKHVAFKLEACVSRCSFTDPLRRSLQA